MKKDSRLNQKQIEILNNTFSRVVDGETMEEIAKSHGISRKTLSLWKNSNHGKQLHSTFQKEMSTNDLPRFYQVLSEKMQSGSYRHMELYAKVHGLYADKKEKVIEEQEINPADRAVSEEELEELKRLLKG
ncbi:phBC6A51 family helix-turn-helix protein [Priestia megaterium]|uniref:phBC6A51 family helix-turn-helix protein n=1 Tax=Priestia megaterium TaxID=1404 RepID=UPI000D5242C1|nr:phBC6A51 family helix-turn-helix protein [Priestia megaterium]PVE62901.1 hypothetical protein DC428_25275 [Priestia megaterium]PVE79553.1 hypothetical protein DC421_25295 [Priestia megaterium]PVE81845.1 hypothetical protein DC426_23930 [Priestia megaterium]PVE94262.1 hypothetical protein DC433_25755 [Priestia megaterium]